MKLSTVAAASCAVAVFATAMADAWAGGRGGSRGGGASRGHSGAHHHHAHTRVFVGSSFYYGPMWYPAPYYYYPPAPVYVEPEPPAVYIEQGQDPESQAWYYCRSAKAYYPYATECPEGWQRVVPDLPSQQPAG